MLRRLPVYMALSLVSFSAVAAPAPIEMSPLQKQQIQTREYDASLDMVYPAVVSVVQDVGLNIVTSDRAGGILTAVAPLKSKTYFNILSGPGRKRRTQTTSFFMEPRPNSRTRVRLNITNGESKRQFNGADRGENQDTVLDPSVYQSVFEKIDRAVFVRTATDGAGSIAPVAGSTPSQVIQTTAMPSTPN